jgi:hypothetical protein
MQSTPPACIISLTVLRLPSNPFLQELFLVFPQRHAPGTATWRADAGALVSDQSSTDCLTAIQRVILMDNIVTSQLPVSGCRQLSRIFLALFISSPHLQASLETGTPPLPTSTEVARTFLATTMP